MASQAFSLLLLQIGLSRTQPIGRMDGNLQAEIPSEHGLGFSICIHSSGQRLFSKNCPSAGPRRFFPTILPSGSIIKEAGIAVMLYRRPTPLSHILRSDNCVHSSLSSSIALSHASRSLSNDKPNTVKPLSLNL